MSEVKYPASKAIKNINVNVTMTGVRMFKLRAKIGAWFIYTGFRITGIKNVNINPPETAKKEGE